MATSQSSQLEERTCMCCGVCMEGFNNGSHIPKILPCQHTFCQACIVQSSNQNSLPASLQCPICRCEHVIPQGGFVTNRVVIDIVEEFAKDTTGKTASALKCTKHANKEAVLVCIDCLDALCLTCVKSSMQIHANHHIEEVDEATPVLQQKFRDSQSSLEKNLLMLEKSPCSSTELAKAEADIKSLANKIHAETTKWETKQLSMVREMKSFKDAHEKKKREVNPSDIDLSTLIPQMKLNQYQSDVENDLMQKLRQRQAEDQNQFAKSLQTLLKKIQSEIQSINAIQSKYLKKAATETLAEQGSLKYVPRRKKYQHRAAAARDDDWSVPVAWAGSAAANGFGDSAAADVPTYPMWRKSCN